MHCLRLQRLDYPTIWRLHYFRPINGRRPINKVFDTRHHDCFVQVLLSCVKRANVIMRVFAFRITRFFRNRQAEKGQTLLKASCP